MGFDFTDFIDIAEDILTSSRGDEQAALRTVAGRSYYGPYGLLKTRINLSCGPCEHIQHKKLWKYSAVATDADIRKVLQRLKTNYMKRIRSDYRLQDSSNITFTEGEGAIDVARASVTMIDNLATSQLKAIYNYVK